ncbi:transaldolase [Acidihalobacter prosperus]|uniref:Transaldolase n=1 Tax=Acidihalobacter prosperus TaxID=160660 RepID=A0A1A6C6G1_9GAMM|nr:transaldolase [Acidihalobacter prosperus]OBS10146.1 Transaldolase [Acidihalobacter prosperus]
MSNPTPPNALAELGQSIWLDYIRRDLMSSGELQRMVSQEGLRGMTSNPAIFDKALSEGGLYDAALVEAYRSDPQLTPQELFFALAVEDIRAAADHFADVYRASGRRDGFVSLEVSPELAHDADATVNEALALHNRVNRANVMIKVPATRAGLQAIRHLTEAGISINVTLLFSVSRYAEVVEAYLDGLEARLDRGLALGGISSVASFFVSRVDSLIDDRLAEHPAPEAQALQGRAAIANAQLAYAHFLVVAESPRWRRLAEAGANPQRLLWASTSTKNPDYPPLLYVDELVGAQTVNTLPPATYRALLQRGQAPVATLPGDVDAAREAVSRLAEFGIDLPAVTDRLESDGVAAFADAFQHLLGGIAARLDRIKADA